MDRDEEDIEAHRNQARDDLDGDGRHEPCYSYNGDEVDIGVGVIWSPCHNCGKDHGEHAVT